MTIDPGASAAASVAGLDPNVADEAFFREPSLVRREARALLEPLRLLSHFRKLRAAPTGDLRVVVLPGFGTSDIATAPLRAYLGSRGHRVSGWELGRNRGNVPANLGGVTTQIERFADENAGPVALVGWSLGGAFAREVTRDRPELVTQIIAMATPIMGNRKFSAVPQSPAEAWFAARHATPITRPITSFYSRRDGAVDWRGMIDRASRHAENIEVNSTHFGITLDPDVWLETARRLASDGARGAG